MEIKNLRILPASEKTGKSNHFVKLYNYKEAEAVTEQGRCIIAESIEKLKEAGFDSGLKTRFEKFGDTIFPVTYGPNGLIIIDYPSQPFK